MTDDKRMRTLYLDTETTGLSHDHDELVELALIDDDGATLIDTLLRPERLTSWPEAERIHGISPGMVASAPTLAEITPALVAHCTGARLVVYNASYDLGFLPAITTCIAEYQCAMLAFARWHGEWNAYRGSYRWQRLETAARTVEHCWDGSAHRARADALACRSVWRFLQTPGALERVLGDDTDLADLQRSGRL